MKIWHVLTRIFVFIAILYTCVVVHGQDIYPQEKFFTAERFFLATQLLDIITGKPDSRRDLKIFTKYFSDGVYAVSNGNYRAALNSLYRARRIWPEYFGTDFLIALSLERKGDIPKAARFYKGYLDKLKALGSGDYPISAPLIRAINTDAVDNYSESKARVEYHLRKYDIDLAYVKPPVFIPDFVKVVLLLFLLAIAGIIIHYTIIPYFNMRDRIKNAPEGYWVCRKCGEINLDLSKECGKCGFGHEHFHG